MDADLPLLEAIQEGDEGALEELMHRHQSPLFYFVLRYLGDELAAREVVQETFVRAYFKAGAFQPRSSVKTWIFTIALNLCRDVGRRRQRSPTFISLEEPAGEGSSPLELAGEEETADETVAEREELEHLRAAINRLPGKLKTPLVLCLLEERSHKEAADLLGTTPKTVELRIYRAKKKLRGLLARMREPRR